MASITKKPNEAVSGTTLKRDGTKLNLTWAEKSKLTDKDNEARHQSEKCVLYLTEGSKGKKGARKKVDTKSVKVGKKAASFSIPYADLYPKKANGKCVTEAMARIYGVNEKGAGTKYDDASRSITVPPKPKLATPALTVDGDSAGDVSCAVSVPAVRGNQHRTDIQYTIERQSRISSSAASGDNTASAVQVRKPTIIMNGTDNGVTVSINEEKWQDLRSPGEWIRYTFKALSRGLAGDSGQVSASYDICWPAKPVLKEVVHPDDKSRITAVVSANVSSTDNARYVTDQMQLQIAKTEASYPSADDWNDLDGSQGTAKATALTYSEDITPAIGQHVFIRVKATNDIPVYVQYSNVVELTDYYRAPKDSSEASESEVGIVNVESGADGASIKVVVGWNDDSNNACEVAYSADPDAWRSDDQPTSVAMETDATWEDDTSQAAAYGKDYKHTAWLKLTKGIEEGSVYYVKARRYSTAGDGDATGWTPAETVRTSTTPSGVVLSAPPIVALGSQCTLTWAIGGDKSQVAFVVKDSAGNGVGDGGSEMAFVLTPDMLQEAGEHKFRVEVQTTEGGDWSQSDEVTIMVKPAPVCSVSCDSVISAKPFSFVPSCDTAGAKVTAQLIADGISSKLPYGDDVQRNGDVVWSETIDSWDTSMASWEVPGSAKLVDSASYYLRIVAVSDGLRGEVAFPCTVSEDGVVSEVPLTVAWAHQALAPSDGTAITADDASRSVSIVAAAPDGYQRTGDTEVDPDKTYYSKTADGYAAVASPSAAGLDSYWELRYADGDGFAESDVCDVYRLTMDGCYLIAEGVPFGAEVIDRYAPFSDSASLAYRLATRTADGDVDWNDFAYELGGSSIRLDWGAHSVECEYDIEVSDEWEKGFEGRTFMDGTKSGSWSKGVGRNGSISCSLRSGYDAASEELLRDLAKHEGPVFVRTPDGLAYQANVDVSGLVHSYSTGKVTCSLRAEEIALTDFMANVVEAEAS